MSDARVVLATGTLYSALRRMLEDGWVDRIEDRSVVGGRERKLYQLTEHGRRILKAETARLRNLVNLPQLKDIREEG